MWSDDAGPDLRSTVWLVNGGKPGCRGRGTTGTPLARLRKKASWLSYLQCVLESLTVRDAARVVGVDRTTSFRWRHRFVPGAMRDRPRSLTAIVEAGETYRLESQKGSRTLTRRPRKRGGVAARRGKPLPDQLFRLATHAGCAAADDAPASAASCRPAQLDGAVTELTRTQPKKKAG